MKKLSVLLLACGLTLGAWPALGFTVSINQFVEHPSLDNAVQGFKDALKERGLEVVYKEHNAQGNMPTVLQIVNQIVGEQPDLVLCVATPSAQATVEKIKTTPVLFTAVTDPVVSGLVTSLDSPGANVTGTTDMNPVAEQVALIRELQPQAKTLGVLYNSGEINSQVQVKLVKKAAAKLGFKLYEGVTPNTSGVYQAAQSLVGKVDAIYLPTDNTVISSFESVIKVSLDHKLPIYPAEDNSIRKAGVAVLSINYYELGRQTGVMAANILQGQAKPADVPVEGQLNPNLIVNAGYAAQIGLTVPQAVLDRAKEIIK
ncbi:MAG: ABC transporter substrate-binding protein [Deltaproteobacteria bacterium]|jgi:putative ABC transport system substrate-binding protein|nr:ABC transporter substrate-binding protein [Deltaproteobacteria bacterium]